MGFWFWKFTFIYNRLSQLNKCPVEARIPKWMTKGKTTLIQTVHLKETILHQLQANNVYTYDVNHHNCTAKRKENYSFKCCKLFPEEQIGCHKGKRVTDNLIYMYPHILRKEKSRHKNSVYGMNRLRKGLWYGLAHLHKECLKMFKMYNQVMKFILKTMENW